MSAINDEIKRLLSGTISVLHVTQDISSGSSGVGNLPEVAKSSNAKEQYHSIAK